jgi:hypothetical protein
MQECNNENPQYKYEESSRPDTYGRPTSFGFGFKRPRPWWWWQMQRPFWGGPFYPGGYGFPWLWFALRSMDPRDAARFLEEMDYMDY